MFEELFRKPQNICDFLLRFFESYEIFHHSFIKKRNIDFKTKNSEKSEAGITLLKEAARNGENLFEVMMDIVDHCTVGEVTKALFEIGGQFRRNM